MNVVFELKHSGEYKRVNVKDISYICANAKWLTVKMKGKEAYQTEEVLFDNYNLSEEEI